MSEQRHEPDVRAPQWERQWCVVDNEDWPCAAERRRLRGERYALGWRLERQLREAFDAERATSQGNPWSDVHSREFVIRRMLAEMPDYE